MPGIVSCATSAAAHRLIRSCEIGLRFTRRRHIFGARLVQDVAGTFRPVRIVAMGGQQNATPPDATFVSFCLVFRNPQADESSSHTANRSTNTNATKQTHDRARR